MSSFREYRVFSNSLVMGSADISIGGGHIVAPGKDVATMTVTELIGAIPPLRCFRFVFTAAVGSALDIFNCRVINKTNQTFPPNMTSVNTPSPYVVSASSRSTDPNYGAMHAFDSAGNTRWLSSGSPVNQWLQVDVGAANAFVPVRALLSSMNGSYPTAFRIDGSATGSFSGEQYTLYSASGLTTGWGHMTDRYFDF